jgi:hypothetical protein
VSVEVSRIRLGASGSVEASGAEDDDDEDADEADDKHDDDNKGGDQLRVDRLGVGVRVRRADPGKKASTEDATKQTRRTVGRFISPAAIVERLPCIFLRSVCREGING